MNASAIGDMVQCMALSKHHSLIVTGNAHGMVTTWDLETAKIMHVHQASSEKITMLGFGGTYPILFCASEDGSFSAWATKTSPVQHRYSCLARF